MKIAYAIALAGLILSGCNEQTELKKISSVDSITTLPYPKTAKQSVEEEFYGTKVQDPYRWLEDDRSEETKAWVNQQNQVTEDYLAQIPYRGAIKERLTALWNYEKTTAPFTRGDYTYFYKNDGLQNQFVLYRKDKQGQQEKFLDPNTFSADGSSSLAGISFSKDGSLVAYQISEGGSDWRKIVVLKTQDKTQVGDTLIDVKFSDIAWKGNEGFYYSSYDKPAGASTLSGLTQHHKLLFHALGTPQSQDQLIFGGEDTPRRYISAYLSSDERFLVISAANTTSGNELYVQDLHQKGAAIETLVDNFEQTHSVLDSRGDQLYIVTNLNAPNYRVVTADYRQSKPEHWKDLIAESEQVLSASTGGQRIFAHYLKDATSSVFQYDMDGKQQWEITLPGPGSASGFSARPGETQLYYTFTSYTHPSTIYAYDITKGTSELYQSAGVDFDPQAYQSEQVFVTSKDGTKIPMIITYKKGLKKDGNNPTYLYAYGGFNISLTPAFSTANIVLLEQGGIFAVANLRGGGEYGEKWHTAGTKLQKQNVFDDFIASAEYLIQEGYTRSDKLAIAGGSNGGLLVGAVMTQRPELFKVAFPAVGVLDMLRYHKFTSGAGWAYDYGTAEDGKEMFEYLLAYSPYHALKKDTAYPATLVTTADHDDRVVPAHSFKFAARLQEYQQGSNPALIRIETNAGHGAGKPTDKIIQEQADKWAFMFQNMRQDYINN